MKEPTITIYDKPMSMSGEEKEKLKLHIAGIYIGENKTLQELQDYYEKPYDSSRDDAIDSMVYSIGYIVSDARKGYKYKCIKCGEEALFGGAEDYCINCYHGIYAKKSLWQKIKEMFK